MSNQVPEGWQFSKISQLFSFQKGNISPSVFADELFNYYSLPAFDEFGDSIRVRGSEIDSNKTLLNQPTILVSKLNPRKPRVMIADDSSNLRSCASTEFMAYVAKSAKQYLPFYKQYFESESFHRKLEMVATGSTNSHVRVSPKETMQWEIAFPPLPEQQKIAKILTSVDEVIEKTQAQIDKLKDLKTGMMQELLTNGVGVDGKPHTEFKDSPIGRIPKCWGVKPLESVVERIVDCEHKTAPYVDKSDYLVIRTSNVRNGSLVFDDMKYTHADGYNDWTKRAVPTVGDVLFTREAPAGESCLVPERLKVCMGQRMVLLRPNKKSIIPSFFSSYLTSETASKLIYDLSIGTTVTRINIEDIRRIPCVVPPLEEQHQISEALSSVQQLLDKKSEKLFSLQNTKKALMQDLLTGKVRVTID